MRITPLDVRKQEFRKAMRGLDADEVYGFLATVADEYEAVLNDNKALRERLLELDDKVQEYRSMERTLRDTLITAERVTVESKDNARREANIIIKEAQMEAEKALRDIKTESMKLRQQVQNLRNQREAYTGKLKLVVQSHMDFIESASRDFQEEDRAIRESAPVRDEPARKPRPDETPQRKSHNLFDAPPAVEARERFVADSRRATPPPPANRDVAPPTFPGAPADHSKATDASGGTIADLSAILDRMKEGQRETLQSSPTPQPIPSVAPTTVPSQEAVYRATSQQANRQAPPQAKPSGDSPTARGDSAPSRQPQPAPPPPPWEPYATMDLSPIGLADPEQDEHEPVLPASENEHEVTGEWNMEQIRRDIFRARQTKNED